MNFKEIHIGTLISQAITERGIEMSRICNFMKCPEKEIRRMYESKSLDSETLLKWSKLLEYDFFRIYSQHLIFYSPASVDRNIQEKSLLPKFRKNIYTKEVVDFILEQIRTGEMTRIQIMERYRIPKTTLYNWIEKYSV